MRLVGAVRSYVTKLRGGTSLVGIGGNGGHSDIDVWDIFFQERQKSI